MSIRNDGIGGTPRLARYITFTAADDAAAPTPGRPPLPKRTPGETSPGPGRVDGSARSPELSRAIHDANSTARTHLPNRTTGECHRCGGIPGPCRPFSRAITILDRWDPPNARRIRAVLHLSGLMPAGYVHDGKDESAESYGALDDV
ncbi:hypothetical protein O7608_27940 [Solwaraspora sp. WMMA2056]|uniref:hypothetical protein n=1 Tax=Solwaraspora sp. WMMA2056 TaxID=3015161 RepID=UPI00259B1C7F|nr:hypothetical protein [Solwaraspora sp. WMMA2056]WJK40203.1 hypothetical protein O7608_27940 [Solwaraspora sp. WMMA2056]